jgi:hypothetical protein
MHRPPQLTVSAIVCAVKNARRYHGYEYAKSVTAAACSSTQIDELDDEEECHSRADKGKEFGDWKLNAGTEQSDTWVQSVEWF